MTYYHVAEYNAACQLIEFKDGKWVVEFTKHKRRSCSRES